MPETRVLEDSLSPDEVRANTMIVDVTDDPGWLAAARWEVAAGYSRLADPSRPARLRDIYKSICQDGYERDGRSRTLAALTTDPATGVSEISGTVRVVLGREPHDPGAPPAIDGMHFVAPLADWPHRRSGRNDGEISELGRFVIPEKYRTTEMRDSGVDAFITGALVWEATRIEHSVGGSVMYALMPVRVAELLTRAGIALVEVPSTLRNDDPHAAEAFEAFSLYWKQSPPKLYVVGKSGAALAAAFATAVRPGAIVADSAHIQEQYAPNVTALARHVPLALLPENEAEVSRIVAIANQQRIPLYPFSTGKNWGLGSRLPVTDDCVVVDLSRMNRIVEVNEDFAYAILEPGVTQLQLARHLNEHHPALTLNFTGSFAHTGIVGNVLERGDGAHARVDDLLGVRGILGGGEPFAVGGIWERAADGWPAHASRYTAGPDLCGLFCQSSFGVVTQLAFRLMRKPERRCLLWGSVPDDRLTEFVDRVGDLAGQGAFDRGSVNIGYANRFVQAQPTMAGGATRTPNQHATEGAPRSQTPSAEEWNFYLLIGGLARATEVLAEAIAGALSPLCAASGTFQLGQDPGDHDRTEDLPAFLQPLVSPLLGMPDSSSIRQIYALTGTPLPADDFAIDADRTPFGMKCYIGVVPPRGRYVRQAADIVAELRRRMGINLKASFFGDGRTLVTIHFRADDPAQVREAEACEAALWDAMLAAGFAPYRVGIDQMQRLVRARPEYFALVARLKRSLDPNGIISPGRYCPTRMLEG